MEQFKLFFFFDLLIIFWLEVAKVESIVRGTNAELGEFPYMVSVRADNQHICGGTIIGERHVLTAAHCVIDLDNAFINKIFSVRGGMINLNTQHTFEAMRYVVKIFVPKEYKRAKHPLLLSEFYPEVGDLAMLELESALPLDAIVLYKAKLPVRNDGKCFVKFFNENVNITGFGSDTPNSGVKRGRTNSIIVRENAFSLKYITATVMHKNSCASMFLIPFTVKHMCAQVENTERPVGGPCNGDSGGPLMLDKTVIGVLSQNREDCDEQYKGSLYTRVSSYVPFINKVLMGRDISDSRIAVFQQINTGNQSVRAGRWVVVK